uniref:Flowering time control protein FCA n=3 Tax=Cucumis melo TaxID=3656 RepID=A0A9I9D4E9_CUCME
SSLFHLPPLSSILNRLIILRPPLNFCCSIPFFAKLERHHPSSSGPSWPSDDRRPNFNHQFDPYVQYPNHHPGPPFGQPNYPPQYPPHPPPPPPPPPTQHQPPFQPQPPPPPPPPHQHQLQHPFQHQHQQNNWNHPEFHNHPPDYRPQPHFNGEMTEGFGNGGLRPNCGNPNANLGRKRPRNYSNRTVPGDHAEASGHVKLYVAQVPRTGTEEAIRPLFEVHGDIVEIVILRDKITGQQQGSCFVKYSSSVEADRAIRALDNQYTFPGELTPINVKYADSEKDRLGVLEKLYVGSLNKNTTKREIEEVFSPYGFVEDIYIIRDDLKQSRGSAFVKYARRDMALAAIKALNGNFTMRGCDQPLIVRLADPKKPRIGEQRSSNVSGSPRFGHHPQPFRPEPPVGPAGGCFPNNSYPGQQNSPSLGPPRNASQAASHTPFAPNSIQKPSPQIQEPPSSFAQMSSQPMRSTQQVCQPPIQTDFSKMQNQVPCQQPRQDSHQQQNLQPPAVRGVQTFSCTSDSPMGRPSSRVEVTLECDWSEHTCPDGFKYYYNCVTYESLWEKPEEFALFEKQLKQEKLQKPNHQIHSSLPGVSSQEVPPQPNLFSQKLDAQYSSAVRELDCMRLQSKASPVVSPACV